MEHRLPMSRRMLAILAGGFLGAIARSLLSPIIQAHLGNSWPVDIFLINISGAFLLAFFTTVADAELLIGPTLRLFLNVGFLGAYTTFSSLALGDVLLFSNGKWLVACFYLVGSFLVGLIAVICGDLLGQWIIKQSKPLLIKKSNLPLSGDAPNQHVDIQDDVLLP